MPEIQSVLLTALMKPQNLKKLSDALAPAKVTWCRPSDRETIASVIDEVDVVITNGDASAQILDGKRIRWIHCLHAGLDKTIRPDLFERGIILTGSAGRSAPALAEHAMMFMLALNYDVPMLEKAKANRYWPAREMLGKQSLFGKTVGLVGLGNTGRELALRAKAFGMRVVAWRRQDVCPENVDRVFSSDKGESVKALLAESDYVVLCCELNDETWHILNREALSAMKPEAILVNIGRGGLVDEPALIDALKDGRIRAAGLDTVEKEPLPESSPLWELPNVMLTPHVTPALPDREERALAYALTNIEAYKTGGHFVNRLTERDLYTHAKPAVIDYSAYLK